MGDAKIFANTETDTSIVFGHMTETDTQVSVVKVRDREYRPSLLQSHPFSRSDIRGLPWIWNWSKLA